ncbi:MAG: iron ABC transporter permease [Candidatus Choladocola sp.]|nr:iron ABC transporter permease [Candidatus Choladocola sp.]
MKGRTGIQERKGFFMVLLITVIFIGVALCVSVSIGAVNVSPADIMKIILNKVAHREMFTPVWEAKTENIIWNIRLPRVMMAFIVGAGLALCGVLMQALTKNSMADPYVLGISSGASAGAVCVIILGWFHFLGGYSVIFGATIGAALSISLSMRIATVRGRITSTQLVLAGIATSALFTAVTNLIVYGYHTGSDKTKTALYWMVGSLSGATWSKVKYVAIVFVVAVAVILILSKSLDVLLLGDDVAETLGADTKKLKLIIIAASTILTGVVVSVSGVIGFVGLVVPHIVRNLIGSKHGRLIPMVILAGGLFTMTADLISRVIIDPEELPIGVISAFFGAPFFLYLIRRNSTNRK